MSKKITANHLQDKHYLTLVIRLLVDQQGKLQQGVVVDLSEQPVGQFRQLEAIPTLVAHWLNTWASGQRATDPNNQP